MAELSRSFRMGRSDSYLSRNVGRSKSSNLLLESISTECDMVASYERLSQSMRLPLFVEDEDEAFPIRKQTTTTTSRSNWRRILARAFSRNEGGDDDRHQEEERKRERKEKRKKRSSWLPDPHRRWPVQGW